MEYYKEQGNAHFKKGNKKDYIKAIELYTEGLQIESTNTKLRSVLLLNRAAVNLQLGRFFLKLKKQKLCSILAFIFFFFSFFYFSKIKHCPLLFQ